MKFQDLTTLLEQDESIFKPRKMDDREIRYEQQIQKQIQDYIKNGFKGDLYLYDIPIKSLPNNLKKVGGNLDLSYTPITSLPADLTVGGNLDLSYTPIKSLPNNLKKVGGHLYIDNTPITLLPAGLKVGGDLWVDNTPIAKHHTKEQIKQMYPGIKGQIYT